MIRKLTDVNMSFKDKLRLNVRRFGGIVAEISLNSTAIRSGSHWKQL
jgi:hypothetical protein